MRTTRRNVLKGAAIATVPALLLAAEKVVAARLGEVDPIVALHLEMKRLLNEWATTPRQERVDAIWDEIVAAKTRMATTPATTIDGVARKLCVYEDGHFGRAGYMQDELLRGAVSDACRLAGGPFGRVVT